MGNAARRADDIQKGREREREDRRKGRTAAAAEGTAHMCHRSSDRSGPLRPPRQPRCPPVLPPLSSLLISYFLRAATWIPLPDLGLSPFVLGPQWVTSRLALRRTVRSRARLLACRLLS